MTTLYYTISSNNISNITNISIESYLRFYNKNIKIYIVSPTEIENKINRTEVVYINAENIIPQKYYEYGIHNICKWLKSQLPNIVDIYNFDRIIYSDSDILYFKNINDYLDTLSDSFIHISHEGYKIRKLKRNKVCSGFIYFNPNKFKDFYIDWSQKIENRISSQPKLLDQPCLQEMVDLKYCNSYNLIDKTIISQIKEFKSNCYGMHYIFKNYNDMILDYKIIS